MADEGGEEPDGEGAVDAVTTEKREAITAALNAAAEAGAQVTFLEKKPEEPATMSSDFVGTFDTDAVDFVRSRSMRQEMWNVKEQHSNVMSGAAPSKLDQQSELVTREQMAQGLATDVLVYSQHTGKTAREGADVSFFDTTLKVNSDKELDPHAERTCFLQRLLVACFLSRFAVRCTWIVVCSSDTFCLYPH